jgi:hypothetical protein
VTLIVPDDGSQDPRTHALVIGVGGYQHLQGGPEERDQVLEQVGLLRQLTSPPRSALAVAHWLQDRAARLHRPLGSVDLLLSVAPGDDLQLPGGVVPGASRGAIEAAYAAWRDRCDRHEDNVALFYFCGHGLEKSEQYLLAEDFGANRLNPWAGAVAIDCTRLAFNACRARTQCFFIDACRSITSKMLLREPQATPLEIFDHTTPESQFNLTAKAAARNEEAFGPPNGVSWFTQALLRALGGAAARPGDRGWTVETGGIAAHINEILEMVNGAGGGTGRCSCTTTGSTPLVDVDAPLVSVVLGCTPDDANGAVTLSWKAVGDGDDGLEQHGGPWRLEAPPGMYQAAAQFDDPRFRPVQAQVLATPPGLTRTFPCAP